MRYVDAKVLIGPDFGEYGGVVVQAMKTDGSTFPRGHVFSADVTAGWPMNAKVGLARMGKMQFFDKHGASTVAEAVNPAAESDEDPNLGQFGGVTLDALRTGGMLFPAGVRLSADLVMSWPLQNRISLQRAGRVSYFKAEPGKTRANLTKMEEDAIRSLVN